ncbi:DUF169 domain-containing protein [bacterium]|nr:DUF169 domain-containing protein [bacterium]
MDADFKNRFIRLWDDYFPGAELPMGFYYADRDCGIEKKKKTGNHSCLIADLSAVRRGKALCFNKESIGCVGGVRCCGFPCDQRPDFEYFLSCGIPGKVEGIRYKKTPQLVKETQNRHPPFSAPKSTIVFKRWDSFEEMDNPDAIIFFAAADVLAGLFSLANFDEGDPQSVIAPSCAGCASVVQYPYLESQQPVPKSVMGMFDISARPYLRADLLTFTVPWSKFQRMVNHMEESFLITDAWIRIQKRLKKRLTGDTT